jgi:FMN phosphatase YigB (HAD superfamily)
MVYFVPGLDKIFKTAVVSGEAGCHKPDKKSHQF